MPGFGTRLRAVVEAPKRIQITIKRWDIASEREKERLPQ